jgi:hypothetical protein
MRQLSNNSLRIRHYYNLDLKALERCYEQVLEPLTSSAQWEVLRVTESVSRNSQALCLFLLLGNKMSIFATCSYHEVVLNTGLK